MLPGRKYRPEDFVEIAWRRKWVLIVPLVLASVGTFVVSQGLPSQYSSSALILVVPQRVPESYVRSTITTQVEDRIQAISQEILSRTRLERIIHEFDLYPEERRTGIMEDVVEKMRTIDISVSMNRARAKRDEGSSSFRVGFTSSDPRKAMQVTERLASLFIETNLKDREVLAEGTDQFLESQLEEARQQLLTNEKRLEEYKRAHTGQLPQQLQTNLQVMQHTEAQLQQLVSTHNADRDRLLALDRMIAEAELQATMPAAAPPVQQQTDRGREQTTVVDTRTAAEKLESARAELAQLELRLKPEHPDIVRLKRTILGLEKRAAEDALATPLSGQPGPARPVTPAEAQRRTKLAQLQAERLSVSSRIEKSQAEEQRLRAVINAYKARVEAAPTRELEMVSLTRDYETLRQRYETLLSKREDARIAANLERRQIGEQFRLIDPPRMPERPVSPDRAQINLIGSIVGLFLGFALAALLEYRDSSMRTENDVVLALALPVLATIPRLLTSAEIRRHRRRRLVASVATATFVVVSVGAVLWRLGLLTGRF